MAVDQDPSNLHDLAVDAQTDIQKLATGLAHAGAAPDAVHQLTQFAEVLSGVIKVLAEGPGLDQAAGEGQPPGGPGPQGAQPPAPGGPPPGPPGAPAPGGPPGTINHAAVALHHAMLASAANRGQPPPRP